MEEMVHLSYSTEEPKVRQPFQWTEAPVRKRSVDTVGADAVAALLPQMKRMRLRPSIGQLRLQREAEDTLALPSQVQLAVEPELLRASVSIECAIDKDPVQFEVSFPPQYPHRAPQILQVSPAQEVGSQWRYEGQFILLPRLAAECWSSAMGLADILRDLLEGLPGLSHGACNKATVSSHRFLAVPVRRQEEEDVEMS